MLHSKTGTKRERSMDRSSRQDRADGKEPGGDYLRDPLEDSLHRTDVVAGLASSQASSSTAGGAPLPEPVREDMERLFGHPFGDVRITEGPDAAAMGARAFTQGSRVTFGPGEYDPSSRPGLELLGHELAHVVQQQKGGGGTVQAKGGRVLADPGLEAQADAYGARAAQTFGGGDRRSRAPTRGLSAASAGPLPTASPIQLKPKFGWLAKLLGQNKQLESEEKERIEQDAQEAEWAKEEQARKEQERKDRIANRAPMVMGMGLSFGNGKREGTGKIDRMVGDFNKVPNRHAPTNPVTVGDEQIDLSKQKPDSQAEARMWQTFSKQRYHEPSQGLQSFRRTEFLKDRADEARAKSPDAVRGLNDAQVGAVTAYTEDGVYDRTERRPDYAVMNTALRTGDKQKTAEFSDQIKTTAAALNMMPRFEGETYRSANLPDAAAAKYQAGKTVSEDMFLSTSDDQKTFENFPGDTHYHIQGHSGVKLGEASKFGQEEREVLFNPGIGHGVRERFDWFGHDKITKPDGTKARDLTKGPGTHREIKLEQLKDEQTP